MDLEFCIDNIFFGIILDVDTSQGFLEYRTETMFKLWVENCHTRVPRHMTRMCVKVEKGRSMPLLEIGMEDEGPYNLKLGVVLSPSPPRSTHSDVVTVVIP
ncbi:unnamed protein product [Choristocarpus tenellus]